MLTDWSFHDESVGTASSRITDPALVNVSNKLSRGLSLDMDDGLACLETRDLLGLGSLAFAARRSRFGDRAFYVINHHLNYTNVCSNRCKFCAFYREPDSEDAYLLSPEEAAARIAAFSTEDLKEVHLVGAINPEPDFSYYVKLLQAIKAVAPRADIKAFTAVEIDHIARRGGLSWKECLTVLKDAGLTAMPGGGAEIFSGRVQEALFPGKISSDTWLAIHATAHRLGIGTNATMLFGHVETPAERITHLLRLRTQQHETGGFRAFIPLLFHSLNTELKHLPRPTGVEVLKLIATARLILDNFLHIKAYWVMLGRKMAQMSLYFGADDMEGTVVQEKIVHEAGAATSTGMTREDLEDLILSAGFQPVERDTFHIPVGVP